jgi:hypothetical protein
MLRLTSAQLQAEGVAEGDLLVAGEGGGGTVAVQCAPGRSCSVQRIGKATAAAHPEGHLLVVADNAAPTPQPLPPGKLGAASRGGLLTNLLYAIGVVALAALFLLYRQRRLRSRRR